MRADPPLLPPFPLHPVDRQARARSVTTQGLNSRRRIDPPLHFHSLSEVPALSMARGGGTAP